MIILDGKQTAEYIKEGLAEKIKNSNKRPPRLVIISVGDDPASKVYVKNKLNSCGKVGIIAENLIYDSSTSADLIKKKIEILNNDNTVDGIMVQLPLPSGYDERDIIDTILPEKDVDGLTTINIGRLRAGDPTFIPCTAKGIMDLLSLYDITLEGKNITIIGRSNIVGKPFADLALMKNATVIQCHSKTANLKEHIKNADIVVSAIGRPKYFTADIFEGSRCKILIDVGINRDENGKLCGDIDPANLKCEYITPVPGGVGPMTVAELLYNVVQSWEKSPY